MTTPTTPREPLDLEALERHTKALEKIAQRYGTYAVADVFALLARIRELEAERRWRPISEADHGTAVLVWGPFWLFGVNRPKDEFKLPPEERATHFQPLPAPPTTEAERTAP
jgi:hypothetical protein